MSDEKQDKRPSHIAYHVSDGQDGKSYFDKVGAAWAHKDGEGYNVQLDSTPIDGRITLRTPKERLDSMREQPEAQENRKDAPQKEEARER